MRIVLKQGMIAIGASDDADAVMLERLADSSAGHVFHLRAHGRGVSLHDLGPKADACNDPINVHGSVKDQSLRLIGNLANTPFDLDGMRFASVEGFWQGLKFEEDADRHCVAALHGVEAKKAGGARPYPERIIYRGRPIRVGRRDHWALMKLACQAKFHQHAAARQALLTTGSRPLMHKVRHDSDTIPGVIMADIWMAIRAALRND